MKALKLKNPVPPRPLTESEVEEAFARCSTLYDAANLLGWNQKSLSRRINASDRLMKARTRGKRRFQKQVEAANA